MSEYQIELLGCIALGATLTSLAFASVVAALRVQPIDIEERRKLESEVISLRRQVFELQQGDRT